MRVVTIHLYENEHVSFPWQKADDPIVWSHEMTEIEASKLLPSCCEIISIGEIPTRCSDCPWNQKHLIRVSEDWAWPPPHMLASIAFGCSIELKDGWLTLNADQCWCLLKNVFNSYTRPDYKERRTS